MSRASAPAAVRWTAYVAVAIVFALACAFLANWQFTRNADRAQQLALVEQNYDDAPVPLAEIIPPGGELQAPDEWRPVLLEGRYAVEDQLLVRNRPHGGTAAFEVLVPFRLTDGRVLLVNRGWVRPGETQPLPDEIPAAPEGEVTVIVRMRPAEQLPTSGRSAPEGQLPTIHPPAAAEIIDPAVGGDLELSAYGVLESEDPAPATRPTPLEVPSEDPGPHLSYAIQWILFAVMGFVFIGYIIRTERHYRREDAEERRPRDRDMQDEDSILDAAEITPVR
ncbi:SURF1 family protein [Microbacterium sp. zg.B48]|uniref:SURF1 family cytochrome oxidase biogenesis protein n=1 Tax=Microbacterium sp. zg.B48 TaxID=2969408 RepID=UPI00214CA39A|nr:SURF1 family protein [Microbacterium sp. zg.B48]MCR2762130.1 SURF1 family protein [Microbacterium sp. zg.B48]